MKDFEATVCSRLYQRTFLLRKLPSQLSSPSATGVCQQVNCGWSTVRTHYKRVIHSLASHTGLLPSPLSSAPPENDYHIYK